jgi:phosphatidylglycerophosphate synthase
MAERLPRWLTSDQLSGLALVALGVTGLAFTLAARRPAFLWLAVSGLAVNWFGDSLDGTLARVRRLERPRYGYYVDHLIDLVGTTCLLAGLAASPYMTATVSLVFLCAYLLVAAEVYLATHAGGVFRMAFLGVGPTELRILLAVGAITAIWKPSVVVFGRAFLLFDVGGCVGTVGLLVALSWSAIANGRRLAALEPTQMRRA